MITLPAHGVAIPLNGMLPDKYISLCFYREKGEYFGLDCHHSDVYHTIYM